MGNYNLLFLDLLHGFPTKVGNLCMQEKAVS